MYYKGALRAPTVFSRPSDLRSRRPRAISPSSRPTTDFQTNPNSRAKARQTLPRRAAARHPRDLQNEANPIPQSRSVELPSPLPPPGILRNEPVPPAQPGHQQALTPIVRARNFAKSARQSYTTVTPKHSPKRYASSDTHPIKE